MFGETTESKQRDVTQIQPYREALVEALDLKTNEVRDQFDQKDPEVVRDFIIEVCKNVQYYNAELSRKLKTRRLYFWGNVILILAVPFVVYMLSMAPLAKGQQSSQIAVIVAQLTAALTGLFGLQKVFLEWQKQSNRHFQLWEAKANLKTEYYALRTKWHEKVASKEKLDELLNDMKNATANARAIVRKEQDDFFKSLSAAVPVDALNVLKEVQTVWYPGSFREAGRQRSS